MSGDMVRQKRDGTWEALAHLTGPTCHVGGVREAPSYKATKGKGMGRASEEAIVPGMDRQENLFGGKGHW